MVRFHNAVVTILEESVEMNDDGDYIGSWSQVETIEGDVQPHSMTQDEIKLYGVSEAKGNVRLFLYNGYHPNVKVGNRASVLSAFTGKTELFSIMPINAWSRHGECILIPVENEDLSENDGGQEGFTETDTEVTGGLGSEETEGGQGHL